jgi:hypothetical protein
VRQIRGGVASTLAGGGGDAFAAAVREGVGGAAAVPQPCGLCLDEPECVAHSVVEGGANPEAA